MKECVAVDGSVVTEMFRGHNAHDFVYGVVMNPAQAGLNRTG